MAIASNSGRLPSPRISAERPLQHGSNNAFLKQSLLSLVPGCWSQAIKRATGFVNEARCKVSCSRTMSVQLDNVGGSGHDGRADCCGVGTPFSTF